MNPSEPKRQLARAVMRRGIADGVRRPRSCAAYWRAVARAMVDCAGPQGYLGALRQATEEEITGDAEPTGVDLVAYRYVYGGLGATELMILCRLARWSQPDRLFEIGTFLGATTLQLAANTLARVFTLDLPPRGHPNHVSNPFWGNPDKPGSFFHDSPYAERIEQLFGDSRTFDFSPYARSMDFVFVDGSHKSEPATCDARNALEIVSPGGAIVWHDYGPHAPELVEVLDDLSRTCRLRHIPGTSLVVYVAGR